MALNSAQSRVLEIMRSDCAGDRRCAAPVPAQLDVARQTISIRQIQPDLSEVQRPGDRPGSLYSERRMQAQLIARTDAARRLPELTLAAAADRPLQPAFEPIENVMPSTAPEFVAPRRDLGGNVFARRTVAVAGEESSPDGFVAPRLSNARDQGIRERMDTTDAGLAARMAGDDAAAQLAGGQFVEAPRGPCGRNLFLA